MAGNLKIALPENIALLLHPHVAVPWSLVVTSQSLAMADQPEKRHNVRVQQQEAVSDWLNPFSLGTMSAPTYIENVA